ncbi:MAG: hypothetical protein U0J70_10210 [Atopobiaceae bacterium]|jgi:hypothetical protein|nr:hypothetical protein [Atopobiaceae bacterium]
MKRLAAMMAAAAVSVAALAGCTSTYTTQMGDTATFGFNNLNSTTSKTFKLPYKNMKVLVEVEQGTVDVEVLDVLNGDVDDDNPTVVGLLAKGEGITDDTSTEFVDTDGWIAVRVNGVDATGKVVFEKAAS